ncbi:hypothetical protein [Pseudoxanthomonas sp. 3HH-4]|uniref:hypothetical protein n=1 Tax=Pseudoxanthomonas sp. 3HH-4 TaxID=1690214 RepID=UPI0011539C4E|nr:hypothetical protein [Pseudoxanthomonas sp. 3HH-4]
MSSRMPVVLSLLLFLAVGQAWAAGPDQASLRYYPAAGQVRVDVEAAYHGSPPGEIDGRTAGRYLLLAGVLEASWGGKYGPKSFEHRAPARARQLRDGYLQAYAAVRGGHWPAAQPECVGRTIDEQVAKRICARVNFMEAENRQQHDFAEVSQVAERYFPAKYQDDFVAHSLAKSLADARTRALQEQEARQRAADASRALAQKEAMARRLVAGGLLVLLLVPLTILALLIWRARSYRRRNATTLTRITSIDDLHLFATSGRLMDVQRHTRTHVTTTTDNVYVHPDSYQSRTPSTTTTVSTTDHLTLFVRTDDGRELQESFVDLPLAVRSGNRVAIVYGGDTRSRLGVAVAVVNMDTRDVAVDTLRARGIASRFSLLRAAFWGLAVAAAGTAVDLAFGMFVFALPTLAVGFMLAMLLAFAWQRSLWANIRGQIQIYAKGLIAAN